MDKIIKVRNKFITTHGHPPKPIVRVTFDIELDTVDSINSDILNDHFGYDNQLAEREETMFEIVEEIFEGIKKIPFDMWDYD